MGDQAVSLSQLLDVNVVLLYPLTIQQTQAI